jgi:hypothetical protein
MSINIATYALVSALAVGGAVAQHQYSQQPQDNGSTVAEQPKDPESSESEPATNTTAAPLDCNGLMGRHHEMIQQIDTMDEQASAQLAQMKEANSDRAKLDATMGLVETLVTQRKQLRDQMMEMEHQTLQLLLTNRGADLTTSCPQLTQWLQTGTLPQNTDAAEPSPDQGGPDDLELGSEQQQR